MQYISEGPHKHRSAHKRFLYRLRHTSVPVHECFDGAALVSVTTFVLLCQHTTYNTGSEDDVETTGRK